MTSKCLFQPKPFCGSMKATCSLPNPEGQLWCAEHPPGPGMELQELQERRAHADPAHGSMGWYVFREGLSTHIAHLQIPPQMDGSGPF